MTGSHLCHKIKGHPNYREGSNLEGRQGAQLGGLDWGSDSADGDKWTHSRETQEVTG